MCQLKGERRLADAARAGKDQPMRQLAGTMRGGKLPDLRVVTENLQRLRRLGNAVERIVLLWCNPLVHRDQPSAVSDWAASGTAVSRTCSAAAMAASMT